MDKDQDNRRVGEVPSDMRTLRACMVCSLVKTLDQFIKTGCNNCEFLQMKENKARVLDCTSASFEGLISLVDPDHSWVARWQHINTKNFVKGVYAVNVNGRLPAFVINEMEREGKRYVPRSL